MKSLVALLAVVCAAALPLHPLRADDKPATTAPAKAGKFKWYTSIKQARKAAAEEKKPVFTLFTGSDWCPYCIKLEKEVLAKPEFKEWAKTHAILYIADAKGGASKISAEGAKLMKEYGAKGFPTVVVTDAEGKALGKTGYTGAKPADYCKALDAIIAKGE